MVGAGATLISLDVYYCDEVQGVLYILCGEDKESILDFDIAKSGVWR